jgi:hypothetical protein
MWPIKPDSVKPMTPPQLWKEAEQVCGVLERRIQQSMDVNEMMLGKMPQGRKNNQLMGAMMQEQQTNITDHAQRYEEAILNPLLEMLFEFDQQFREEEITVESRGEIGVKAALEVIPPAQWGERYFFRWTGTEAMVGMQRLQQQIGWVNVLKGIPPQLLGGRQLDLSPLAESGTEKMFGPEMAPRILIDKSNQFFLEPEIENEMMFNGFHVAVHEADNDPKHMQSHMMAANINKDPLGLIKEHMLQHAQQMQQKRERQMAQQGGVPGAPGGGGQPGAAGTPKPGAMPGAGPRPGQNPPGAVSPDQMADPMAMPRG